MCTDELCTIPLKKSTVNFDFMFQYVSANAFTLPCKLVKRFYSNAQAILFILMPTRWGQMNFKCMLFPACRTHSCRDNIRSSARLIASH